MSDSRITRDWCEGRSLKALPNLEALKLSHCFNLANEGLVEILSISVSKLRYLDVSCSCVSGMGWEEEVKSLPNLETLILNTCSELFDEGLVEILRICGSKLVDLDLSCTSVTGIGLEDGVKSLPMLENLDLGDCDEVTDSRLLEILRIAGKRLKTLIVSRTYSISAGLKQTLHKKYPIVNVFFWCRN